MPVPKGFVPVDPRLRLAQGMAEVVFWEAQAAVAATYPGAEIGALYNVVQAGATPIPSVGNPTVAPALVVGLAADNTFGQGQWRGLFSALHAGGHWVCIEPSSDLPMIGITDGADRIDMTWGQDTHREEVIWIGQDPVYIEHPILKPLLLPPLARYVWNHRTGTCLLPLCGSTDNAALSPRRGLFKYYVQIRYGKRPCPSPFKNHRHTLRIRLIPDLVHTQADHVATRYASTSEFVFPVPLTGYSADSRGIVQTDIANWLIHKFNFGILTSTTTIPIANTPFTKDPSIRVGNKVQVRLEVSSVNLQGGGTINSGATLELYGNEE